MRDLALTFMAWTFAIGLACLVVEFLVEVALEIYFEFFKWRRYK